MKKRRNPLRFLPTKNGVAQIRQEREIRSIIGSTDAAYTARRFKERKGKRRRFFLTPIVEFRIERAARFKMRVDSAQRALTESHLL